MRRFLALLVAIGLSGLLGAQDMEAPHFKGELIVKIKGKYGQKYNKSAIAIPAIYN